MLRLSLLSSKILLTFLIPLLSSINNNSNNSPSLFILATEVPLMLDNTKIVDVKGDERVRPRSWADSYSVGDRCYCASTYDHDIGTVVVDSPFGKLEIKEVCKLLGRGPGMKGRPVYNDIQCGNGPANNAKGGDEISCPGRVDHGIEGCKYIGPKWNFQDVKTGKYRKRKLRKQ